MPIFGELAGVVSLLAYCVYIASIFKGKSKPNRATWWIWTVVGFILASSYYYSGATDTIWVPISNSIGPLVIAVIALKRGEGGWTRFDQMCLFGAAIGLFLWWIFNSALLALLSNLFVDFMGALPTVRKTYRDPLGENTWAWILFFTANTLNLFALNTLNFAIVIYPLYLFVISAVILTLVFARSSKSSRKRAGKN